MSKKSQRNQVQQAGKIERGHDGHLPSYETGRQDQGHASAKLHAMPENQPATAADNFRDD